MTTCWIHFAINFHEMFIIIVANILYVNALYKRISIHIGTLNFCMWNIIVMTADFPLDDQVNIICTAVVNI